MVNIDGYIAKSMPTRIDTYIAVAILGTHHGAALTAHTAHTGTTRMIIITTTTTTTHHVLQHAMATTLGTRTVVMVVVVANNATRIASCQRGVDANIRIVQKAERCCCENNKYGRLCHGRLLACLLCLISSLLGLGTQVEEVPVLTSTRMTTK